MGAEPKFALTPDRFASLLKRARPWLIVVIVAACAWAIATALRRQSPAEILAALEMVPLSAILIAAVLVTLNFGVMSVMEALALEDSGVHLPRERIVLSAFIGNALSVAVGMGPISGAATRAGLFQAWGAPPQAAAATALSVTLMSLSGGAVLAAAGIAVQPGLIASVTPIPEAAVRGLAIFVLVGVFASLAWASRKKMHLNLFGVTFSTPTTLGALARLGLGATDWLISANILYAVLAHAHGPAPAAFATTFASAHFIGMAAGMPAGLGVFDALILHIGTAGRTPAEVAAALLVYRLIAYLAPSIVALGVYLAVVRRNRAKP